MGCLCPNGYGKMNFQGIALIITGIPTIWEKVYGLIRTKDNKSIRLPLGHGLQEGIRRSAYLGLQIYAKVHLRNIPHIITRAHQQHIWNNIGLEKG